MTAPLTTIAAQITDTGISAPSYADILDWLKTKYRSIYGDDVYLEADSQDGQWLAIQASAYNDVNALAVAVYNSFSPSTAKDAALSSLVKINGLTKNVATNSTVPVTIIGELGTVIANGLVGDDANNQWALPAEVDIPLSGTIDVTATCTTAGAVIAPPGSVSKILTPTRGWQTVTNAAAGTPGAPVESNAQLRQRQAVSTALPALTSTEALVAAVSAVQGVTAVQPYVNRTSAADANGIPAWSTALVIAGGDETAVAQAILNKMPPGPPTFGSTTLSVLDPYGVPQPISFSRPTIVELQIDITIKALAGYTSTIGDQIDQAFLDYVNGFDPATSDDGPYPEGVSESLQGLSIGETAYYSPFYLPAGLFNGAGCKTYKVTSLQICVLGGSPGTSDVAIAFNERAELLVDHIALTVT